MRRPRFTIAGLLGVVAFAGVAFASLREPTDAWDSTLFGLTVLTLLVSVLLAVHRSADRRAFRLGFALFGWSYLAASQVQPVATRLPTTKALVTAWEKLARREIFWDDDLTLKNVRSFDVTTPAPPARIDPNPPAKWDVVVFSYPAAPPSPNYIKRLVGLSGEGTGNFVRIGHSLFAMCFALVGAHLSRYLFLASGRHERA
jgi:hypothetical protein